MGKYIDVVYGKTVAPEYKLSLLSDSPMPKRDWSDLKFKAHLFFIDMLYIAAMSGWFYFCFRWLLRQ